MRAIEAMGVVVPAHDEELELGRCLAALTSALLHPALAGVAVRVAIVLDDCTDASGDVAQRALAGLPGVDLVEVRERNVGAARAAGFARILESFDGLAVERLWLATTDADSRVARDWLARQRALACSGWDAIAGAVAVDAWQDQPSGLASRFQRYYDGSGGMRTHVHGANLGLSASAYALAGGVPALALAEDHALIDAVAAQGHAVLHTRDVVVTTSARRESRAPGGFSDFLRKLSSMPEPR